MEELLVCHVCLATDVKLFNMYQNQLVTAYEHLTGTELKNASSYPCYLCSFCSVQLVKSERFQEKCITAQELLNEALLLERAQRLTCIKLVDRKAKKLNLSYKITKQKSLNITEQSDIKTEMEALQIKNNFNIQTDLEIKHGGDKILAKLEIEDDIFDNDSMFPEMFEAVQNVNDIQLVKEEIASSDEEPLSKMVKKRKRKKRIEGVKTKKKPKSVQYVNDQSQDYSVDNPLPHIEVVLLTLEEQIREVEKRKESQNYIASLYKCDVCFKGFMSEKTFQNHTARHDPSLPYACEVCHITYVDKKSLTGHIMKSHSRNYVCKLCNTICKCSTSAKEHVKWHEGFTYDCKICGASFSKKTSQLTHIRLQHPSQYVCRVCGESFLGQFGLEQHYKRTHRGQINKVKEEFKCGCGIEFRTAEAFERHLGYIKDDVCDTVLRPCVTCGESFETETSLKDHMKDHQKKDASVKCSSCNRKFANAHSHAMHYQRIHLGIKKHDKPRGCVDAVCEICGRKCRSRATLVYHQRTHSGDKPFQCTHCPKRFSVHQRLQEHMRIHTGVSPYPCSHCPKAFKHKAALNRHNRVHTGAKPYGCPHCGKAFSQSNSVKTHVKTVHMKLPDPYKRHKRKDGLTEQIG